VPVMENGGHECLVARVSAIGDAISAAHGWDPWADRHVAQRNIAVVQVATPISRILSSLDATRFLDARVQLLQVGRQAAQTVQLVAPNLKVDPAVQTHVLAELSPQGRIFMPQLQPDVPAALPAIHPLAPAEIFAPDAPAGTVAAATGLLDVPRVAPHALLDIGTPAAFAGVHPSLGGGPWMGGDIPLLHTGGNVPDLVRHGTLLSPELVGRLTQLAPPAADQAQVLRVASYRGDQLVGGYTIVVRGS
jgi:hypothetical protein